MNRLDRFRFGTVHKRRMAGFLGVVASVLVLSLLMLAFLGIFGSRSELVRVRLTSANAGLGSNGVGINLDYIPVVNRIRDPSFEVVNDYRTLNIADSEDDYVFFDTSEDLVNAGTFPGCQVKIYSIDNDGSMSLKFDGSILGFDEARFASYEQLEDINGYWLNDPIVKTVNINGNITGLTQNGKLITDIGSASGIRQAEDIVIKDICASSGNIYAITGDGDICYSADGRNFSDYLSLASGDHTFAYVASCGGNVLLVSEDDELYIVGSGREVAADTPFDTEDMVMCSGDGVVAVIDSTGDLYYTYNGLIYSKVNDYNDVIPSSSMVRQIVCDDQGFYILTASGHVVFAEYDMSVFDTDISMIEPEGIASAGDGKIIAVTSDKKACMVDLQTSNLSDLTSGRMTVDSVFNGNDGRLIVRSGNNLFFATVMAGIQVSDVIGENSVMPGDICVINRRIASVNSNRVWSSYGEGTTVVNGEDSSLRITGGGNGLHILTQPLAGSAADNFTDNTFYRISLKLRCENIMPSDVKIWISGDKFGDEGFVVSDVSDKWNEYSYVFAVTDSRLEEDDQLHFNISFEGEGVLYADDVYVGEDKYQDSNIPQEFTDLVKISKPAAIRLNNLGFEGSGFSESAFYKMSGSSNSAYDDLSSQLVGNSTSLEESLRLVSDSSSCPWFVVGPYADRGEINDFITYLCGSVSSEYGRLRIDNGTALPWSRQFDTIYIEINDNDDMCSSDMQRGAYVSYVINLISQSEYYKDIKDRIVFLDGMEYEGGVVLSSADYHCDPLLIDGNGDFGDIIRTAYSEANYNAPRMTSHSYENGEFISSLSFGAGIMSQMNYGRLISSVLMNEASYIRMNMVDIKVSHRPCDTESEMVFAYGEDEDTREEKLQFTRVLLDSVREMGFLRHSGALYYDVADPLDASSPDTAEDFVSSCTVCLVENEDGVCLMVANYSDTRQQFIAESGNIDMQNALITRYSADAARLTRRHMNGLARISARQILQPGEVIIIEVTK